ncbi:MAG: 16S rRNA (adenine(1518)-N(6)/adenine(1519)-N(6))-dimethyltransferase RsmA [Phycisphaerales bacterium JB052]
MQTLSEIKELLERAGHPPKKALGQNFLTDHNMIRKLVDDAEIQSGDRVLEVGPGTGALSVELLDRGVHLVACELDSALAQLLRETLGEQHPDRFTLIEGDCLARKRALNPTITETMGQGQFKLVANLPYSAATPLMLALMTQHPNCSGMFVTIQHEVVQRFNAPSSTKAYGTISVIAQQLGSVGTIAKLPPGCFWPQPGVASAMMRWSRSPDRSTDPQWWTIFAETTQQLFQSRRKQLAGVVNKLVKDPIQWPEGVKPTDRIDALPPDRIETLCRAIHTVH